MNPGFSSPQPQITAATSAIAIIPAPAICAFGTAPAVTTAGGVVVDVGRPVVLGLVVASVVGLGLGRLVLTGGGGGGGGATFVVVWVTGGGAGGV